MVRRSKIGLNMRMINKTLACVALAGALAASTAAGAATITTLYNTGVNNSGVSLPGGTGNNDPHYTADSGLAQIGTKASGLIPVPPWLPDSSTSAWIGLPTPLNQLLAADSQIVDFRTTFDLTGFDPLSAAISGILGWATDDFGRDIKINGVSTSQTTLALCSGSSFCGFTPFSITSGFIAGINTLDFIVQNTPSSACPAVGCVDIYGGNPFGLRVEMTGTAAVSEIGPTPLPSTWLMLLSGFVGLGYFAYRGSKKNSVALAAA